MMSSKERFCCYCGESLGVLEAKHYDRNDTCGNRECEREVAGMMQEDREEAHEQLDRDMGW